MKISKKDLQRLVNICEKDYYTVDSSDYKFIEKIKARLVTVKRGRGGDKQQ